MPTKVLRNPIEVRYQQAAEKYLGDLKLEHIMEATPQATQRKITLASLALVEASRPEVQVFNELLVQYPRPRKRKPGQVVPDNMVVLHAEPIKRIGSYDVPSQPAHPFWMLEYVSKESTRKDYRDNMRKYEDELKVPYYLIFDPDKQKLTLYHHTGKRYVRVRPDEHGRYAIKEIDLSVGILDGWARFWFQGELLALPAELQLRAEQQKRRADQETQRADEEAKRAEQEAKRAEQEAKRAEQEAKRADEEAKRAEQEAKRADEEAKRADEEAKRAEQEGKRADEEAVRAEQEAVRAEQEAMRAEQEGKRADEEAKRADEEAKRAEQEAQRANVAEREIERLRAQLEGSNPVFSVSGNGQ